MDTIVIESRGLLFTAGCRAAAVMAEHAGSLAEDSQTAAGATRRRMRSRDYGSEVLRQMRDLQRASNLTDFTVETDGSSILVHKMLLAATSDYFKAMLMGPTKESKEDIVKVKGLSSHVVRRMIDFIYSGELDLDMENLVETINAASHLQISTALDLCSTYVIDMLTFSNSEDLLQIADTYSLVKVTDFYNTTVLNKFEEFSRTEQFLKLTGSQLTRYLVSDKLRVRSESFLFEATSRWYDANKRPEELDSLLRCIRFALMTVDQLNESRSHWLTGRESVRGHPWIGGGCGVRAAEPSLVLVHQGSSMRPFEITAFDPRDSRYYHLASDMSGSRDCRVVVVDNFVFVCRVMDCGGGSLISSLLRFDPRHLTVQELMPCRHLRIDPALTTLGHVLYIFGGTNDRCNVLDTVESYDVRENAWKELSPLPIATQSCAAAELDDTIYLSGGVAGLERTATNAVYSFNPATQNWKTKAGMICARRLHDMCTIQSKIYVIGGIGMQSFHQQTHIPAEVYSPDSDQWTLLTATLAGRSAGHFLPWKTGILSIGREHYEATEDDVWLYDVTADKWRQHTKVPRRSGLSTAAAAAVYVNFSDERIQKRQLSDKR